MIMRLTDLLALSHVPRWSIVRHSPPQSVADHSFRVAVIAREIVDTLNRTVWAKYPLIMTGDDLWTILTHDGPESRTGDLPSPFKAHIEYRATYIEPVVCPWLKDEPKMTFSDSRVYWVFVVADRMEAATFIRMNGQGPHAAQVAARARVDMFEVAGIRLPSAEADLEIIYNRIVNEAERIDEIRTTPTSS